MHVPRTVPTALEDRPVAGAICLEAGAGVGKTTAGLLAADARRVYAVTNDRDDATTVRDRICRANAARVAVIETDVRALPLDAGSVDVITAHGLFNVLSPAVLPAVRDEFTRVAAPGCHLVIDDYEPIPPDSDVSDLFAVENAASQLARGRPALSFYSATLLRSCFEHRGWRFDRERRLLEPVPWTPTHIAAHANRARAFASQLPPDLGDPLVAEAERLVETIDCESVGTMYSIAMRLPD